MPGKVIRTASLSLELELWRQGRTHIFGIDEAGRGAWAGCVAAAVVCFAPEPDLTERLAGLTDSKLLSPAARKEWSFRIREHALAWGIGWADAHEIDAEGILPATRHAMKRALDDAAAQFPAYLPDFLLVDHIPHPHFSTPHQTVVRGDSRSLSIAAASILAKTWRDERMSALDAVYPDFGFGMHKGYGTQAHQRALQQHGATDVHRYSFEPVRRVAASLF
jgi:ribonuclease HII